MFFSLKVNQESLQPKKLRYHLNCWRIAQLLMQGFALPFVLIFLVPFIFKRKEEEKKTETPFTCHMSQVTCYVSNVTCPMSGVIWRVS